MVVGDEGLSRLLDSLGREAPPDVPVERLFRRLLRRRIGFLALGLALITAPIAAFLVFFPDKGEPPVHLDLHVVTVGDPEPVPRDPGDLNLP